MSDASARLLTFEIDSSLYALPISDVAEVTDLGPLTCIPTVPKTIGAVTNYHGDALPVIHCAVLFGTDEDQGNDRPRSIASEEDEREEDENRHLLVLSHRGDESLRLGIPVDHVRGLVDGAPAIARDGNPVAERRPLDGRVAHILDTQQLLEEAEGIFRRSVIGEHTSEGEKREKNSGR